MKIKDDVKHLTCVVYQGTCSCEKYYIGETMRNAITRIDEHEQANEKLEPSEHLKNNPGHQFDWMILPRAPWHNFK